MRFAKLRFPKNLTDAVQLSEISLTKKDLGAVVALVGKNGAGKSRILKLVENYLNYVAPEDFLDGFISHTPMSLLGNKQHNFSIANDNWAHYKVHKKSTFLQNAQNNIMPVMETLRKLGTSYIKVVDNDDLRQIKSALDNNLTFEAVLNNDHQNVLNPNNDRVNPDSLQQALLNEFGIFNSLNTFQYFTNISTKLAADEFNLYLQNKNNVSKIAEDLRERKTHVLFNRFKEYVKKFLGKDFNYITEIKNSQVISVLTLNNRPLNLNQLSPGQRLLFAYAVLFFFLDTNSKTSIRESIIIVDEPEKHLHPEAQIALIDALRSIVNKKGQLWIATHSVHILAHLKHDEIFMVQDDSIIVPSRITPGKSLNELMGIEGHIHELQNFLTSTSQWAYANFMCQCLNDPDVVFSNDRDDPQYKLFKERVINSNGISILDFGAGKGRIGQMINDDDQLRNRVNYYAYEPLIESETLRQLPILKGLYSRIADIEGNKFDFVILCNVLHEISPLEWSQTIHEISRILKNDGSLLFIEDKFLPTGETAHEFGFLILRPQQLKTLVNSNPILEFNADDPKYADRIIFCSVPKESLNVTEQTVFKCLGKLKVDLWQEIRQLKKGSDVNHGRQYANLTQLYINAELAIESFEKKRSDSKIQ